MDPLWIGALVGVVVGFVLGRLTAPSGERTELPRPMGTQSVRPPATPDQEVDALLRAGRKIEAIKLVRERTGLGLKAAKDLVEEREQRLPAR